MIAFSKLFLINNHKAYNGFNYEKVENETLIPSNLELDLDQAIVDQIIQENEWLFSSIVSEKKVFQIINPFLYY